MESLSLSAVAVLCVPDIYFCNLSLPSIPPRLASQESFPPLFRQDLSLPSPEVESLCRGLWDSLFFSFSGHLWGKSCQLWL